MSVQLESHQADAVSMIKEWFKRKKEKTFVFSRVGKLELSPQ